MLLPELVVFEPKNPYIEYFSIATTLAANSPSRAAGSILLTSLRCNSKVFSTAFDLLFLFFIDAFLHYIGFPFIFSNHCFVAWYVVKVQLIFLHRHCINWFHDVALYEFSTFLFWIELILCVNWTDLLLLIWVIKKEHGSVEKCYT